MNRLWTAGRPIQAGDPVSLYLRARLGQKSETVADLARGCLRTAALVSYRDASGTSRHPAMLARVTSADGQPVNIHRTFLTKDGAKAGVPEPRKVMPGALPRGCAIRLAPGGETLGIAEGIETALAATILFGLPCWSAINAALLAAWVPPAGLSQVIVFADHDANFAGQSAACALAHRLRSTTQLRAEVRIPPAFGQDWADVLADRLTKNAER